MKLIKYSILIIIGILIFFILNNNEKFNIGIPWVLLFKPEDKELYVEQGKPFIPATWGGVPDDYELSLHNEYDAAYRKAEEFNERYPMAHLTDSLPEIYYCNRDTTELQFPQTYIIDLPGCNKPTDQLKGFSFEIDDKRDPVIDRTLDYRMMDDIYTGTNLDYYKKHKMNEETKPLIPANNVEIVYTDGNDKNIYQYDDTLDLICSEGTRELASQTSVKQLKCRKRRKIVLFDVHGHIYPIGFRVQAGDHIDSPSYIMNNKTVIPTSLQLMIYKTSISEQYGDCPGTATGYLSDKVIIASMLDIYGINDLDIKDKSRKSYLQILSNYIKFKRVGSIKEITYSETEKLVGNLYVHMNTISPTHLFQLCSKYTDVYVDTDDRNIYHCFTKVQHNDFILMALDYIQIFSILTSPFFVSPSIIFDSKAPDITNILLQYSGISRPNIIGYDDWVDNYNSAEGIYINMTHPPEILENIYVNGIICEILKIEKNIPINISDTELANKIDDVSVREMFKTAINNDWIYNDNTGSSGSMSTPVHVPINEWEPYISYVKVKFELPIDTLQQLKKSTNDILKASCATIHKNKLTLSDNDILNRLFPNAENETVKLPLFYLNIYLNDLFVNPSTTDFTLDENAGDYTASDIRAVIEDIVKQIYNRTGGYYELYREKVMYEKNISERECDDLISRLYIGLDELFILYYTRGQYNDNMLEYEQTIGCNIFLDIWGDYGYSEVYISTTVINVYEILIDGLMILIKLFKQDKGEDIDLHAIICTENQPQDIFNVKKTGTWDLCKDKDDSSIDVSLAIENGCEYFESNPEQCDDYSKEKCCICGGGNRGNIIGPYCTTPFQCDHNRDNVIIDVKTDPRHTIKLDDWNIAPVHALGIGQKPENTSITYTYDDNPRNHTFGILSNRKNTVTPFPIKVSCESVIGNDPFEAGYVECNDVGRESRYISQTGLQPCPNEKITINKQEIDLYNITCAGRARRFHQGGAKA